MVKGKITEITVTFPNGHIETFEQEKNLKPLETYIPMWCKFYLKNNILNIEHHIGDYPKEGDVVKMSADVNEKEYKIEFISIDNFVIYLLDHKTPSNVPIEMINQYLLHKRESCKQN